MLLCKAFAQPSLHSVEAAKQPLGPKWLQYFGVTSDLGDLGASGSWSNGQSVSPS